MLASVSGRMLSDEAMLDEGIFAVRKDTLMREGMTLVQLHDSCCRMGWDTVIARPRSVTELENLLAHSEDLLILNYDMTAAGQAPWGGHFAPIGGYHEETGSVLVLDPWPYTEPVWIDLEKIVGSTQGCDKKSGEPRGILRIAVSRI